VSDAVNDGGRLCSVPKKGRERLGRHGGGEGQMQLTMKRDSNGKAARDLSRLEKITIVALFRGDAFDNLNNSPVRGEGKVN